MFNSTTIFFLKILIILWFGVFFLAYEDIIFEAKLQIRMIEDIWKMRIDKNNCQIQISYEEFGL